MKSIAEGLEKFISDMWDKTIRKALPLPATVLIYDDQQPMARPKPHWLQIAKFNEPTDAVMFCCAYKLAHPNARLHITIAGFSS